MTRRFDQRTNVFNAEGRITQIEYAIKAIKNSGPAMAVHFADGILIATEKRGGSALLVPPKHGEKIFKIDEHLYLLVSGLVADANYLIEYMRKAAQDHRYTFGTHVPLQQLVEELCDLKQAYTQSGGMRPFGNAFIFAGWDSVEGFQIFSSDPSGNMSAWRAIAQGANEENSNNLLQEHFLENLSAEAACELLIRVIMQTLDTTQPDVGRIVVAKLVKDTFNPEAVRVEYLSEEEKRAFVEQINLKYKDK